MNNQEKEAIKILEKYNQHHIIEHIKKLGCKDRERIIEQVNDINFEEMINLYKKTKTNREKKEVQIKPLQTIISDKIQHEQKKEYIEVGQKVLKENKFAVVTLAGGQGTRLRASWTKGEF